MSQAAAPFEVPLPGQRAPIQGMAPVPDRPIPVEVLRIWEHAGITVWGAFFGPRKPTHVCTTCWYPWRIKCEILSSLRTMVAGLLRKSGLAAEDPRRRKESMLREMTSELSDEERRLYFALYDLQEEAVRKGSVASEDIRWVTDCPSVQALCKICRIQDARLEGVMRSLDRKGLVRLIDRPFAEDGPLYAFVVEVPGRKPDPLLARGTEVGSRNRLDAISLHDATAAADAAAVELLLAQGAGVNAQGQFEYVVAWVPKRNADGANLTAPAGEGLQAAGYASRSDFEKMVRSGQLEPIVVREEGWSPLHVAAKTGHSEIVSLLLEKGADVDAQTASGCTALYHACRKGFEEVAAVLLQKGANPNIGSVEGGKPLHCAISHSKGLVEMLLAAGADVDARNAAGWTPLHWVALIGREDLAQVLVDRGADVDAQANDGRTPSSMAADAGHEAIVRLLADHRARGDANG